VQIVPPRLLVINPNISTSVTDLIEAEARQCCRADTQLTMRTAHSGVAYIETRFEAMLGAYAAAEIAAQDGANHDAVVVAAFGDPGVLELREILSVPVVGLTEAALSTACLLGQRIAIIAISQRIQAWYREVVQRCGLEGRLASIRALDKPLASVGSIQEDHAQALLALALTAVEVDGADVLILAGAPLAGLAREVADQLPVPVVDGVSCAIRQAELLVATRPAPARMGSFCLPPRKPLQGLPPAIERLLAGPSA